jgi:hypothetical protein
MNPIIKETRDQRPKLFSPSTGLSKSILPSTTNKTHRNMFNHSVDAKPNGLDRDTRVKQILRDAKVNNKKRELTEREINFRE